MKAGREACACARAGGKVRFLPNCSFSHTETFWCDLPALLADNSSDPEVVLQRDGERGTLAGAIRPFWWYV